MPIFYCNNSLIAERKKKDKVGMIEKLYSHSNGEDTRYFDPNKVSLEKDLGWPIYNIKIKEQARKPIIIRNLSFNCGLSCIKAALGWHKFII